ncbi:hypothetical protein FKP32DRAFT_983399 [Trametes sanguinea]|nr:hypothetical protein FKP32DRAFT_983399 [Trametes sanguinea]
MSPPVISISTNKQDHLAAARALSAIFYKLGVRHAYIGGFAWSLLGSIRPTEDIDVLIQDSNILELRERLIDLDPHFVDFAGFKLYYVTQTPDGHLVREQLVRSSTNNVLVETLSAGSLGLPVAIVSTYRAVEAGIDILHPGVLILTKFKRWSVQHTSTRPKTIRKNSERIRFDEYKGKSKPELLAMIRKYHDKYADDVEQMEKLRSIMPDDWVDMLGLTEPDSLCLHSCNSPLILDVGASIRRSSVAAETVYT